MNHASRIQVNSEKIPLPRGHFSHATRAGDTVYVSGLLAFDHNGDLHAPGEIAPQTERIFEILSHILEAAGATLEDVVQMTSYLTDITERAPVNAIRARHFGTSRPASTLVEVSGLAAKGAVIEIDAVAVIRTLGGNG